MPDDAYLDLADCEKPEDLERIDPRAYSVLAGRPASQLDLMRTKLEVAEHLREVGRSIEEALRDAERRS